MVDTEPAGRCSSLVVDGKIGVGGIIDREEDEEEIRHSIIESKLKFRRENDKSELR